MGESFILALGFSPWSAGSIALGLWQGKNILAKGHCCLPPDSQEAERDR
jgi:hypothetical protein